jgi:hypothetical protein
VFTSSLTGLSLPSSDLPGVGARLANWLTAPAGLQQVRLVTSIHFASAAQRDVPHGFHTGCTGAFRYLYAGTPRARHPARPAGHDRFPDVLLLIVQCSRRGRNQFCDPFGHPGVFVISSAAPPPAATAAQERASGRCAPAISNGECLPGACTSLNKGGLRDAVATIHCRGRGTQRDPS